MPELELDQIIIGAGMAGLCCAGELTPHGQRPLLISETVRDSVNVMTSPTGTAWLSPVTTGPKIPWTIGSVEGLRFVGDGSLGAVPGNLVRAAAGCGILGARALYRAH